MQYNAAYVGGKCLLSNFNINQLSKIDEQRAQKEAIERQIKYDDLKGKIDAKKQMQDNLCRLQNLDGVNQKMGNSLRATVRER